MKKRVFGLVFGCVLLATAGFAQTKDTGFPVSKEPTTAEEAKRQEEQKKAQLKAEAEKKIDEKYQAWVATCSAEQQEWEKILQANLGGFYLPLYKAGRVKGQRQAWDYVKDVPGLPRVLIIGDSVSRGYTLAVRDKLAGIANVHRAPENCGPTANGVKKLDIWTQGQKWDVVTFNFGIHDRNTPSAQYEARLTEIIRRLRATGAVVLFVNTTPIPDGTKTYGSSALITQKNELAEKVMKAAGVPIVDVYSAVMPKLGELQNPNDVHFKETGYQFLGGVVADAIKAALPKK